jgi:hypothetical protein
MNKALSLILFLLLANASFAQKGKDTVVYNLPVFNGKLIYTDSIEVKGRDSTTLDTIAKKWFNSYYVAHQADTTQGKNIKGSIVCQGILEYNVSPGFVSIPFYMVVSVMINCSNNHYTYKMCNIHCRPKSGFINAIYAYQHDPEYLIKLYKQKHLGLKAYMTVNRSMIRKYLLAMNTVVQGSINSLNKAMAN